MHDKVASRTVNKIQKHERPGSNSIKRKFGLKQIWQKTIGKRDIFLEFTNNNKMSIGPLNLVSIFRI